MGSREEEVDVVCVGCSRCYIRCRAALAERSVATSVVATSSCASESEGGGEARANAREGEREGGKEEE